MIKFLSHILRFYQKKISEWGVKEAFFTSFICHMFFIILLIINFTLLPKVFTKEKITLLEDIHISTSNNFNLKGQEGTKIKYQDIQSKPDFEPLDSSEKKASSSQPPAIKTVFTPPKDSPLPVSLPPKPKAEVTIKEVDVKKKQSSLEVKNSLPNKEDKSTKVEAPSIPLKLVRSKPLVETVDNTNKPPQVASLLKSATIKKDIKSGSQGGNEGLRGKGETQYNESVPLSATIITSIKTQFIKCWVVPLGLQDLENISVVISINLDRKGSIIHAEVLENKAYSAHPTYKVLADSALRAVYKCSPLKGLPQESYNEWKEMELKFDPQDML